MTRTRQTEPDETFTLVHSARPGVSIRPEAFVGPSISFKARGILVALLCSPAGERLRFEQVLAMSNRDGREATRSGLRELEESAYLVVRQERGDQGRFGRTFWLVSDLPQRSVTVGGLAADGKPVRGRKHRKTGFPSTGAPPCSSSKELLKKKTTTTELPEELFYPGQLTETERSSALLLVQRCPEAAQALLDELTGAIEKNVIKKSRMGWLSGLVEKAIAGDFAPNLGIAVARRRVETSARRKEIEVRPATPEVAGRYLQEIGGILGKRRGSG